MSEKSMDRPANPYADIPTRDDSQSLREFVEKQPALREWLEDQRASGVCAGCGEEFAPITATGRRCFVSISSVWCETKRRHITPSKEAL